MRTDGNVNYPGVKDRVFDLAANKIPYKGNQKVENQQDDLVGTSP